MRPSKTTSTSERNPYQAPMTVSQPSYDGGPVGENAEFARRFRREIHGIGTSWIVVGTLMLGLVVLALWQEWNQGLWAHEVEAMAVAAIWGTAWVFLGAMTCAKQLWAIKIALVVSYLSLVVHLIQFRLGLFRLLLLFMILQAHRANRWANRLLARGIPLNARPEEIADEM